MLDNCLSKISTLSQKVDKVTDHLKRTRRHSLGDTSVDNPDLAVELILAEIMATVLKEGKSKTGKKRQCHHCHRPTSHPEHAGIGSGINLCTLSHFELCPGGRVASPDWTGCPDVSSAEETDTEEVLDSNGLVTDGLGNVSLTTGVKFQLDRDAVDKSILEAVKIAERVDLDQDADDESTDDEEENILQSEIEKLKIQVQKAEQKDAETKLAKAKAERKEQRRLARKRLEDEKADLIRRTKDFQPAPSTLPAQQQARDSVEQLQKKAADLAARQQKQAADRRQIARAGVENLSIGGIRSLPGASDGVDRLLAGLQALVPSLAKTPTAPAASGLTFQPSGVLDGQALGGEEIDSDFVFHPGSGKFVRVVHSPARGGQQNTATGVHFKQHEVEDVVSADEDCDIPPPPGYCFIWKRDSNGEKYFVKKKLSAVPSPVMTKAYVCDEVTGRWYKQDVPRAGVGKAPSVSTPMYRDHRHVASSPVPLVQKGLRTPTVSAPLAQGDRVPGIVPIDSGKQGKSDKLPDRIQWAKNCPVNWTNKVTESNINMVLWAWSYVAEILATRTGMAPNLETGELEARLQHFCHVLEITLQTSNSSEFCGDSWSVARLYDQKVQQKVDTRLFSWVQLSSMNNGGSLPHELIAATQELAKKTRGVVRTGDIKPGDGKYGDGKGKGKDKDKERKAGWKCPSWNYSETRGKCRFEVENAPEKCNRVHECSWCKAKQLTPLDHQRHFCRKRLAEEEG